MRNLTERIAILARQVYEISMSGYANRPRFFTFAESCTGGLLSAAITSIPGTSAVYPGGFVTYSDEAKMNLLGVRSATLASHGAVSGECAVEMARGAKRAMDADFALSITGIAGPSGGSAEKPVGTVWLALATMDDRVFVKKIFHPGRSRSQIRLLSVYTALNLLINGLYVNGRKI